MRLHHISTTRGQLYSIWVKRGIDIIASAIGLAVLSPLFAIIAIGVKLDSPGPIFYFQDRVGRGGRTFRVIKFRTMCVGADQLGTKLTVSADKRVTWLGRFLRHSKLDELPQLINVLAGKMSLVGPRPESPEYIVFYTPAQRSLILSLRPGITDYASILLRNESSLFPPDQDPVPIYRQQVIPLKLSCYQRYFREMGIVADLRIMLATVALLAVGLSPAKLGIEPDLKRLPSRRNAKGSVVGRVFAGGPISQPSNVGAQRRSI